MPVMVLPISSVIRSERIQARVCLDQKTLDELTEAYKAGDDVPAPIVYTKAGEKKYLGDGFHRVEAAIAAGKKEMGFNVTIVIPSADPEEVAFKNNCSANLKHGTRMTFEDKKKAVGMALDRWPSWTQAAIADAIGISKTAFSRMAKLISDELAMSQRDNAAQSDSKSNGRNSHGTKRASEGDTHEHEPEDGGYGDDLESADVEVQILEEEPDVSSRVVINPRFKRLETLRLAFGNTIQIADEIKIGPKDPMYVAFSAIIDQGLTHIKKWKGTIK